VSGAAPARSHRELGLALGLLLVSLVAFAALAAAGWPGAPHACLAAGDCYCEAARPGPIRQPANTWSCLAGTAMGLAIAWDAGRRRLLGDRLYAGLYALIVTGSGVAAAVFHASLTNWGGKLDLASMYFFIDFWILFALARVHRFSRRTFLALYLGTTVLLLVPRVAFDAFGMPIFVGLATAAGLCELLVARRGVPVDRRWLWLALGIYAPALLTWRMSHVGQPLCDPHSLLQGHALWHVLTAASPGALYLYFLLWDQPGRDVPERAPRAG
jgi:hypothetical protein